MKTFNELSESQKAEVLAKIQNDIVTDMMEFPEMFPPEVSDKINYAFNKSEDMKTPWFFAECIYSELKGYINESAQAFALDYIYAEPNDPIVMRVYEV
jgi:hypothetical protein